MEKIRIGVICPSEIAFRRFMPALTECPEFEYKGIAVADAHEWFGNLTDEMRLQELSKARRFVDGYGGEIFKSYTELIESPDIDAVYVPLPPAFHYQWSMKAIENKKHVFVEKPSTTNASDTKKLVEAAKQGNLAIHENYMFQFHSQLDCINQYISEGRLGDLRLIRISFGFPERAANDFRYNKEMGGGALLDCGGYTVKLASMLLGETAKIVSSRLNYIKKYDVDIFGAVTMENRDGLTAQLSFGMDNCYKCELEIWGSKGTISTDRILTAPVGYEPIIQYKDGNHPVEEIKLPADDTFRKSILYFGKCIHDPETRNLSSDALVRQAEYIDQIRRISL